MVARALIPWWHLARAIKRECYALISKIPESIQRQKKRLDFNHRKLNKQKWFGEPSKAWSSRPFITVLLSATPGYSCSSHSGPSSSLSLVDLFMEMKAYVTICRYKQKLCFREISNAIQTSPVVKMFASTDFRRYRICAFGHSSCSLFVCPRSSSWVSRSLNSRK